MDIYIDVDNTVCCTVGTDYPNAKPYPENIARFNKLYDEGNRLIYWTARGMKSGINWRELTEKQFRDWGIKYHELRLDKPAFDVFIDDKAINARDWEKRKMDKRLKRARQILLAESDAVKNIPVNNSLLKAVDMIVNCKGKVVTSGMGKAGIIAKKVSSTFSSTGTPSIYLHPGEAQHGDLGMLSKEDLLIVFSNSGKTREVIEMVMLANRMNGKKMKVITITSHAQSDLAKSSEVVLNIGKVEEVCSLGMAPTTSTTAMLALGDVLCVLVMEEIKFTMEQFSKRHHGGYLGEKLKGK